MNQRHTFSTAGQPPSEIQRGLDGYDRDTIAYLALLGADDAILRRVLAFSGKRQEATSPDAAPRGAETTMTETKVNHAQTFADLLNEKFKGEYEFTVMRGRKYSRIVKTSARGYSQRSVHAFVDREGRVYKAAGWNAPAKDSRFLDVQSAAEAADPYGSYLYKRR